MAFSLKDINNAVKSDPAGFVAECDEAFAQKIDQAAQRIAEHRKESRIVLLSGPSGSGKTTTAMKIQRRLEEMGITTHTVSMDNYFNTMDPETAPRNMQGTIDYESPFCLDMELLNRHFAMLDRGETIHIPKFEFARQMRSNIRSKPLTLGGDELAIFEGIHALNDYIAGRNPKAMKVYISASSNTADENGEQVFKGTWLRLARRVVRDAKFRGSDAEFTMKLWGGVRRGEKLYISPYKENANILFDSAIPYEIAVMKHFAPHLLAAVPNGADRFEEIRQLLHAYEKFEGLDESLVPPESLLREFIGGGIFEY